MSKQKNDYEYKLVTLKAVEAIIKNYLEPKEDHIYFHAEACPLCRIYNTTDFEQGFLASRCFGCFMHRDSIGNYGCSEFKSFRAAKKAYYESGNAITPIVTKAFKDRAGFFARVKPALERSEASRFNPSKWRFFSRIDRSW